MAQNKYLDFNALSYYNGKLKTWISAADDAVLVAAKKYTDEAPFDPAGTAQDKVDALANGAVKVNTEAIAVLNGEGEGSVKKAVADAKAIIDGNVDAVEGKADAAQVAADKAQGEVDALETYVGTFTHATAKSVVEYVDAKTAGIATNAALTELQGKVSAAEGEISTIKDDYLKAADKTALQDQITANAGAIDAIETDYLKAADKTELQGKIDEKATQSALETEIARAKAAEEKNAADIALIMNNPDTEVVDSINEFITYITEHGEVATGLQTQITKNKDDIAAMDIAYKAADTALDNRVKVLEGIDHEAYKAADTAIDNRLKVVEGAVGETGSVAAAIATAKQEAIDAAVGTAAADAATKANAAESNAKAHADAEIDKVEEVVNKNTGDISALDGRMTTAEGEISSIKTALGTTTDVTAAIADAKAAGTAAQGEVDALEGVVSTLTERVATHETYASTHGDRLTALEGKVGDGFIAITNSEIDTLFA